MTDEPELKIYQRIRAFRLKHKLTRAEMAEAFGTSARTMDNWKTATAPACAVTLMDLFEKHPKSWAGVFHQKRKRGRPFEKGNPWRLTSERARALRAKALERVA